MPKSRGKKQVSIIMGSKSDLKIMRDALVCLRRFGVLAEMEIVSAHRTPENMMGFAQKAEKRGIKIIIAGAGGAAHLPGMVASLSRLPVIGVPIKSRNSIDGIDSLLSIAQMPSGIPVATVALDGAENAALLAIRILALEDRVLRKRLERFQSGLSKKVKKSNHSLQVALGRRS